MKTPKLQKIPRKKFHLNSHKDIYTREFKLLPETNRTLDEMVCYIKKN